jgi:hypothetical protein
MASTSTSSSDELLGVFDQNCNEKEKPMKDTYQEFCIKAAWKQQALLELVSQNNGPKGPYKKLQYLSIGYQLPMDRY